MESPFIDLPVRETTSLHSMQDEWMLESPLIDPEYLQGEAPSFNQRHAVSANQQFAKTLWNSQMQTILDYFFSKGFISSNHLQDPVPFAEAIAKWQATQFKNKQDIDGILGPASWKLLKPLLSIPVPTTRTPSKWQSLIKGAVLSPAKPLVDGEETFKAMAEAIRSANAADHYIYVMGWMLDADFQMVPGDPSSTLKTMLTEAAQNKNVQVRALIWDNPAYVTANRNAEAAFDHFPNAMMVKDNFTFGSPGIQKAVAEIKRIISLFKKALPGASIILDQIKPWTDFEGELNALHNEGSHHEKILIVKGNKGLIAFCGGIDINPNRIKDDAQATKSEILHDVHCELRGHAAWELLQRFMDRWENYKRGKTPYVNPYSLLPLRGLTEPEPGPLNTDPSAAYARVFHTYNHPSDPGKKNRSIRDNLKTAIMNAKESVYLEDQYVISLEIATWLNLKLKEPGFKSVGILTQDDDYARGDLLFPKDMRKKFIDLLCKDLDPATIKQKVFIEILDPEGKPFNRHQVHSKMYIIDGQTDDPLAIIGSANCSSRSMTHDTETSAFIFNDKGSPGNFVSGLHFRLNYDDKISRLKYVPNPKVKDRDVQLHADIDHFLNEGSMIKKIVLRFLSIDEFLGFVDTTMTNLKPWIIDVIDPDADNTNPQQELTELPYQIQVPELPDHELPLSEIRNSRQKSDMDIDIVREDEQVLNRNESLVSEEEEMPNKESEFETPKPVEGYVSWAKTVLNNQLGLSLTIDNRIDAATKQALETLQDSAKLTKTGKLDGPTERALLEADTLKRYKSTAREAETVVLMGAAKTKIEDWTKQAVNNKPNLILDSYRDPRKLYAFVLHHMAFKRRSRKTGQFSDPNSYLTTGAHFCIMFDGRIIQLYPLAKMIWHAQCISPRSVSVEFEGNFPNIHGNWWIDKDGPNRDHPTSAQFEAGRFLASYLRAVMGTTHILAHRQSADSRENDPGPDIWYNVGQWSVEHLGMTDGGDFKCGDGHPILPEWQTWGKTKTDESTKEFQETEEETMNEFELMENPEGENPADSVMLHESEIPDLPKAVRLNRYYAAQLGWDKYMDRVNDLLLPYSGLSNVSLGEEAFARAVYSFQINNGFTGEHADGIIGPGTWTMMSQKLGIPVQTASSKASGDQTIDGIVFKKKTLGYDAAGGGLINDRLRDLKQKGKLSISPTEIEMFRLVSIPESDGLVNSVNSYDTAYMSMGFLQFTIRYGELQKVIARAADAFRKYGIELDPTHVYDIEDRPRAIKNAPDISDLRSIDWAVRFYKAGLEDDIVIAQIEVAREIMRGFLLKDDPHQYLDRYRDKNPALWAFIYESYNSRPTPLNDALKKTINNASSMNLDDAVQFGKLLIEELRKSTTTYYSSPNQKYKTEDEEKKKVKEELDKVGRIIAKTGITQ